MQPPIKKAKSATHGTPAAFDVCEGENRRLRGITLFMRALADGAGEEGGGRMFAGAGGAAHVELFHALDSIADEGEVFGAPVHVLLVVDEICIRVDGCVVACLRVR